LKVQLGAHEVRAEMPPRCRRDAAEMS
jgi:hypothetical protein